MNPADFKVTRNGHLYKFEYIDEDDEAVGDEAELIELLESNGFWKWDDWEFEKDGESSTDQQGRKILKDLGFNVED